MQAFVKTEKESSQLQLLEVVQPTAGPDELLVRVRAIGVGIHDEFFFPPDVSYPYVVGIEAAGTVESIGTGVTEYNVGDRVAFISTMQLKGGTWAEYAVVTSWSLLLPIPDAMTYEQAAAMPVAGSTALKAIESASLTAGDTLLICGGAGAIGTLLIQIVKQRGYTVIATASAANHKLMRELGADYVIDYHDRDWQEQVRKIIPDGADAAIAIHPGTPKQSQSAVRRAGTIVAVSGDDFVTERGIVLRGVLNDIDVRDDLIDLMHTVSLNEMKLIVNRIYPFSDGLKALDQVKTRHTKGKIILKID